jgi:replicative DNA helicase
VRSDTASRTTPLREESALPTEPPYNVDAEQGLLGALLTDNRIYVHVSGWLFAEHFGNGVHSRIYEAIGKLIDAGTPANAITLKGVFDQDKAIAAVGGAHYLAQLAASVVTLLNAADYARIIVDLYRRRVLITAGEDIIERARRQTLDDTVEIQIQEATDALFMLTEAGEGVQRPIVNAGDAAEAALRKSNEAYNAPGTLAGISSGIEALDRFVGGFATGFYVFGGRPGSGKSSLMGSIAYAAALNGHHPLIFSGEMSTEQLTRRFLAMISGVSASKQRRGDFAYGDFDLLVEARDKLLGLDIPIDDSALTLPRIRQQSRLMRRRRGIDLILIDYLQLIASGSESESRAVDVGRVSNRLKRMSSDLELPIIALAAISRMVEARDDKRPMLADLRNAGDIEQDTDVVVFVYRHEVYLAKAEPRQNPNEPELKFSERHAQWSNALHAARGKAELIVAKNREDRDGVAHVGFDGARSLFHDLDPQQGRLW